MKQVLTTTAGTGAELVFKPYSLEKLLQAQEYLQRYPYRSASMSAGYLYMWSDPADLSFCVWNDTFCVRQTLGEQTAFSYPCGADPQGMFARLIDYVKAHDLPLRLFDVSPELLDRLSSESSLPMRYACDRTWSDYLYELEPVLSFRGRRFSGQRNHVNRFRALFGAPDIRVLSLEDRERVLSFLERYRSQHGDAGNLEKKELDRTKALYEVSDQLALCCAGLFVNDELCAFSIGEVVGDTLMIHVEKALREFPGAYPTMYQGLARLVRERFGERVRYLNREDDSGDPGLRTSKQQYHPIKLLDKYLVHVFSPGAKLESVPTVKENGIVLNAFTDADRAAYLALNTDIENNRYWGYDYRSDPYLPTPIDEDTFYTQMRLDTESGDSIDFAIRAHEGGELIGEAILWNFTSTGKAELGLRIFPAYQHKGLGRAAFAAATGFAETKLGLQLRAKCFSENEPSRKMILSCGYRETGTDKTYRYFSR